MRRPPTLLAGVAVLAAIGSLVALFAGWAGIHDEPSVAAQMPYAMTGVGMSVVLMVVAVGLASAYHREILWRTMREDVAVVQDQLDSLAGEPIVDATVSPAPEPAGNTRRAPATVDVT